MSGANSDKVIDYLNLLGGILSQDGGPGKVSESDQQLAVEAMYELINHSKPTEGDSKPGRVQTFKIWGYFHSIPDLYDGQAAHVEQTKTEVLCRRCKHASRTGCLFRIRVPNIVEQNPRFPFLFSFECKMCNTWEEYNIEAHFADSGAPVSNYWEPFEPYLMPGSDGRRTRYKTARRCVLAVADGPAVAPFIRSPVGDTL